MYEPSEETKQRIRNRTAHYTNEFFDNLVDVLYMGLKITLDTSGTNVFEMFFYDAEGTEVTLYDPNTDEMCTAAIVDCIVWNDYDNRVVGSLQSVIDVLETLVPKEL